MCSKTKDQPFSTGEKKQIISKIVGSFLLIYTFNTIVILPVQYIVFLTGRFFFQLAYPFRRFTVGFLFVQDFFSTHVMVGSSFIALKWKRFMFAQIAWSFKFDFMSCYHSQSNHRNWKKKFNLCANSVDDISHFCDVNTTQSMSIFVSHA